MTIPRMRAFKCNHGFQAQADVPINSPTQTNNQNVHVIVNNLTKDKEFRLITDEEHKEYQNVEVENRAVDLTIDEGLKDDVSCTLERSVETATEGLKETKALIQDKDNLMQG